VSQPELKSAEARRPQEESLGIFLWSSLFTAVFFLGISLLSSTIPGVNEPHYLAKARAFDDPSWCSRDFFLTSGNAHYCFFLLTGLLTRWLSLDAVALVGRAISCLLLGIGWTVLGHATGLSARWRIFSAGIYAILTILGSFSGEWLLGGFESKVPSWGLSLIAAGVWIHGQIRVCPGWMTAAGVVCGLACALHPVVGGWVAVCLCGASLVGIAFPFLLGQKTKTAKSLTELMSFAAATLLCSLPGLLPAVKMITETTLPLKDRQLAQFYQVFWRLRHHLDPTELTGSQWMFAIMVGTGLVWGVRVIRRFAATASHSRTEAPRPGHSLDALDYLLALFAMSAMIALAGVIIGWHTVEAKKMTGWEWRASLLKFYPFRCFDGLLSITAAIVFGHLVQLHHSRIVKPMRSCQILLVPAIILLALLQAWRAREVSPAGYTSQQFAEWQDACHWIRENTAADALVLTPRESFAFKWFAERAEYVCYKDCPQNAPGILMWNERLWLLHDWTLKSSSDGLYDRGDLKALRETTKCDYILTRILGPFEAEPVWHGQQWRVYKVPARD
jgi:hypothetical protein